MVIMPKLSMKAIEEMSNHQVKIGSHLAWSKICSPSPFTTSKK